MMHPVKILITYQDGSTKLTEAFVDSFAFDSPDFLDIANKELKHSVDSGQVDGVISIEMSMSPKQKYWFHKQMRKIAQDAKPKFTTISYEELKVEKQQNNNWRRKHKKIGGYQGG